MLSDAHGSLSRGRPYVGVMLQLVGFLSAVALLWITALPMHSLVFPSSVPRLWLRPGKPRAVRRELNSN
jgi:hypothetical protein